MRKSIVAIATAATLLGGGVVASTTEAQPRVVFGTDHVAPVTLEKVQYAFGGRRFCWYNGWHGPGYYWCGYGFRRGLGWGGGYGWNGWRWGGPVGWGRAGWRPGVVYGGPGYVRPGYGRPVYGRPGYARPGYDRREDRRDDRHDDGRRPGDRY